MRKKSIWLVLGLLVVSLALAFAGCKKTPKTQYELNKTSVELTVGETAELTVSPAPDKVTWTSSAPAVATVEEGTVTAVAKGTATITAEIEGADPLTCAVTVKDGTQTGGGYSLDLSSVSIKTGEEKQLTVKKDGVAVTEGVVWSSEKEEIATVSSSGLVKGISKGETTVKAAVGGETLSCAVTVLQGYTYSLDKTALDIAAGGSDVITLQISPAPDENARPFTFESANPAVATVDGGTGKVTGVAKGNTTITCRVDDEELTASVKVTEYTVKLGDTVLGAQTELTKGEDATVTVTSDPARTDVTPVFHSNDDGVVTISSNGALHAVEVGSTEITVTVGGRTWTSNVTVSSSVHYTLKAGAEEVENEGEVSIKLGEDVTFDVEREPAGEVTFAIEKEDTDGVIAIDGHKVTANKIGTATITVTVTDEDADTDEPIAFTVTVNVVLGSSLEAKDFVFGEQAIDLTYLDENKTLDWYKYWFNDRGQTQVRMKNNANLIGNYKMAEGVTDEEFWDYPVPVIYEDGDATKEFSGNTYGRAVHGSYTVDVKLTSEVSKIVILTGTWKETAVIQFRIGDVILQENTIVGSTQGDNPPSSPRGLTLTIDTSKVPEEGLTLTIAANCDAHGGNVSLVAVAVIGKTPHDNPPTVETNIDVEKSAEGKFDLTELGNLDWAAVKNGGVYRKAGVPENTYIKTNAITYRDPDNGTFGDDFGKDEGWKASFTWTDGTESAPSDGVHNFMWSNDFASIPVALTKGSFTVSLFVTGWSSAYMVGVYDNHGVFIQGKQVTPTSDHGVTAKVTITLDVKEAGDYTFKVIKLRDNNCGWAAIAVSQNSEYSLENSVFDLTKGGTAPDKIVVKQGDETVSDGVSFESKNAGVVTVGEDGTITVVGKGSATVVVTVGEEQFLAFVTVTEYTLTSSQDVTLSVEGESQITLEADPDHAINASYEVTQGEDYVDVSESGLITAKAEGEAKVTVTVDGKTFEITVHVVTYTLDNTSLTFTLGETATPSELKMKNGEDDVQGVQYSSEDEGIVSIDETSGAITLKGFGKTTLKATKDGVTLECEVTVKLKVDTAKTKDYADGAGETVNLDELDETKVTLDWRYFGGDDVRDEMKDGDLISDQQVDGDGSFYDYRTKINWVNGTTRGQSFIDRISGIIFKGDNSVKVSIDVTIDENAEYISVFTGAYHAKNRTSISYEGVEYAAVEFTNNGNNEKFSGNDTIDKNKQVVFAPDMANFGTGRKTFTITIECLANANEWTDNVSLVAIAVVGKTARGAKAGAAGSATVTHENLMPEQDNTIDLSQDTLDWVYINNNGDSGPARKNGGNLLGNFETTGEMGGGTDGFGTKHQFFTWSDGTQDPSGDNGDTSKTNKIKWGKRPQSISVSLDAQAHVIVTLYISAWQPSVILDIYDAHGNRIVTNQTVMESNGGDNGVKAMIDLTATEASTFYFVIHMEGGDDRANYGLVAVTVAEAE